MSFEIKAKRSPEKNLRKLIQSQVEKASRALRGGRSLPDSEVVHDVRKRFKRIRSAARLSREVLGPKLSEQLNHDFRDAARPLSELRDANVLVNTLDALADRLAPSERPEVFAVVRQALEARLLETRERLIRRDDIFSTVLEGTTRARGAIDRSEIESDDWQALVDGLTRTYRKSVKAYRRAQAEPSDENLHDWRKRVKDLLYQSKMLRPLRAWFFRRLERQADRLADLLGDDHDLAVLRQTLVDDRSGSWDGAAVEPIVRSLDERRHVLQTAALATGREMLAERPDAFADRVRAYRKAWRAEVKAARFDGPVIEQET